MVVVVVTDSSSRLPAEVCERWAIREVPLHVLIGGADLRDGLDQIPDEVYRNGHATTSAATPSELGVVYQQALADSGGDGVVAVHISAAMSGTVGAAKRAAAELGALVRVIDSQSAAMGAGFVALAAARAAATGANLEAVAAAAAAAVRHSHSFVVVRGLDHLRRSGRISGAQAWLGTALSLKPVLGIREGKLVLVQRVRTMSRATVVLVDMVVEVVGGQHAELAVHHAADRDTAETVAALLAQRLSNCPPAMVTDLGPALGVHVGMGAVAVCLALVPSTARLGD